MTCRLDALNCIIKKKLSLTQFNKYCDEFDKEMNYSIGISREFFIVNDNFENIFSYILQKYDNSNSIYIPLSDTSIDVLNDKISDIYCKCIDIIAFNKGHAWTLTFENGKWFKKQSVKRKKYIQNLPKQCGFIIKYSKN